METTKISNIDVELIGFHLGLTGEISNNRNFTSKLRVLQETCSRSITLETLEDHTVIIYECKGKFMLYFTNLTEEGTSDAYILSSKNAEDLFVSLACIRSSYSRNRIDLIRDNAILHGFL